MLSTNHEIKSLERVKTRVRKDKNNIIVYINDFQDEDKVEQSTNHEIKSLERVKTRIRKDKNNIIVYLY